MNGPSGPLYGKVFDASVDQWSCMNHLNNIQNFQTLPVELLYNVQLHALSEHLPIASKYLYRTYKSAVASYHAKYILGRILRNCVGQKVDIFTKALRYPICSQDVLVALCRLLQPLALEIPTPELPRHLFRSLQPKSGTRGMWLERHEPLPLLRYLYNSPDIPRPNVNSEKGYALTKAVHAGFVPLVKFLLDHGASPSHKNGLAVKVAIRRKDLSLVKLLIERDGTVVGYGKHKKRKMEDRLEVTSEMLRVAVKCDARDIIDYLTQEKGCVPDMSTLTLMTR